MSRQLAFKYVIPHISGEMQYMGWYTFKIEKEWIRKDVETDLKMESVHLQMKNFLGHLWEKYLRNKNFHLITIKTISKKPLSGELGKFRRKRWIPNSKLLRCIIVHCGINGHRGQEPLNLFSIENIWKNKWSSSVECVLIVLAPWTLKWHTTREVCGRPCSCVVVHHIWSGTDSCQRPRLSLQGQGNSCAKRYTEQHFMTAFSLRSNETRINLALVTDLKRSTRKWKQALLQKEVGIAGSLTCTSKQSCSDGQNAIWNSIQNRSSLHWTFQNRDSPFWVGISCGVHVN